MGQATTVGPAGWRNANLKDFFIQAVLVRFTGPSEPAATSFPCLKNSHNHLELLESLAIINHVSERL